MHFIHIKGLKRDYFDNLVTMHINKIWGEIVLEILTACSTWPHEILIEAYIYKKLFYISSFFFYLLAAVCWFRPVTPVKLQYAPNDSCLALKHDLSYVFSYLQ
jgi:hypothetical protein